MNFNFFPVNNKNILIDACPTYLTEERHIKASDNTTYKNAIVEIINIVDKTPFDSSDTFIEVTIMDVETKKDYVLYFRNKNFVKNEILLFIIDESDNKWLKRM